MANPLDKIAGLNEDPNVLAQTAPEQVRKKIKIFLESEDQNTSKFAREIFDTLTKQNKKMGKMHQDRAGL